MLKVWKKREFVEFNRENDFDYLNEDFTLFLEGTSEVLTIGESDGFVVDFFEAMSDETLEKEGVDCVRNWRRAPKWESILGEETYIFLPLSTFDKDRICDLEGWPLSLDKTRGALVIERRIPGLREFYLFVR